MASRGVYVEHLKSVALFGGMTRKELERVATAGSEVRVAAGTRLMEEGRTGHDAFVILDGSLTVRRNGRKVAQLGAGNIVGELALLDDGPRSATVDCDTDCSLLVVSHGDFAAVLDDVPALTRKMLAGLAGRIRDLDRSLMG